jgi:hypothetical protein
MHLDPNHKGHGDAIARGDVVAEQEACRLLAMPHTPEVAEGRDGRKSNEIRRRTRKKKPRKQEPAFWMYET